MDIVQALVGGTAGFAAGWFAGYRLGEIVSDRRALLYWGLNLAAMLVALVGNVVGLTLGQTWLWVGSMSFLVTALTGLKYGRGTTVGPGSRVAPEPEDVELPRIWED